MVKVNKSITKMHPRLRRLHMRHELETGFSMLEAVVVVGVLLALAVGGFFAYGPITENAKRAVVKSAASQVHTAVVVAASDGEASTQPQGVIDNWNGSTDKVRVGIIPPTSGGASANGDFCVEATNVEDPLISARTGACADVPGGFNTGSNPGVDPGPNPSETPTPSPSPSPDGSSFPKTANDIDGDGVYNAFDTSPRGETSQHLAGFGGNWSYELGTTQDTTSTTDYIMQGPLAGQRIGLLSENTGSYHTCGTLESTGTLYCWGYNSDGQLGRGIETYQESDPAPVSGLDGKFVSQVVTNGYSTCAIADGAPYCWGNINYSSSPVAVDISGALAGKTITKLVGGNLFACVLADGAPYCWGNSPRPFLGNGTTGNSTAPVAVDTTGALSGKTITDLFAGNSQACVSVSGGGAYCWGDNDNAQIGNGTREDALVPTAVSGLSGTVTVMAGGYSNMCAVADGKAYCWGGNTGSGYNMIGDGTLHTYSWDPVTYETLPSNFNMTPTAVDTSGVLAGKTVTHVDMGDSHVCVIADEAPYCWGEWESSEAGSDGYYMDTASPATVGGSFAAGNRTVGLWTEGGSTIFSYFTG